MLNLLLSLAGFGCKHSNYTWPQGKPHATYVKCLKCGEPLYFDTEAWQVTEEPMFVDFT